MSSFYMKFYPFTYGRVNSEINPCHSMGFQLQHGHGVGMAHAHSSGDGLMAKLKFKKSKSNSVPAKATLETIVTDAGHQHGHGHGVNINVRAAFIHVLGDMLNSVGVFVAALIIYFRPQYVIADPVCTFIFSIIVLFTTFAIMKDALLVLMEGTPNFLEYTEILNVFKRIEGVERVHNLRIWALSINRVALSVHLAIGECEQNEQSAYLISWKNWRMA
uniref:Zinc transporter 2 n=1 Tax=Glossina palpalis gambiensis TaxID=67801 RepID=A0A1B0BDD2_9MUSC